MTDRITIDPKQLGGAPCIRHMRIPVTTIRACMAHGMTDREILDAYPDLEPADLDAVRAYEPKP